MAKQVDETIFSGNTVELTVTVDDEDAVTPAPKSLNGATDITYVIAKSAGKAPILTKTFAPPAGITIVTPPGTDGKFLVTLASADTEALKGSYYHEARIIDAAGKKATVLYGTLTVNPNSISP